MNFTQPVSMVCTEEQYRTFLREPLLKMGYQENDISYWGSRYSLLVTNLNGIPGEIGNIAVKRKEDLNRYYIETFNPDLCLALAAMSSKGDDVIGEYWTCLESPMSSFTVGKVYKSIRPLDMSRAFEDNYGVPNGYEFFNLKRFRKSTLEELVEQLADKSTKEENMAQKSFKTTRQDLLKIWDIACSDWKERIEQFSKEYGEPFSTEVELPFEKVEQMFKAANEKQLEVLRSVFPTYLGSKNAWIGDVSYDEMKEISEKIFGDRSCLELAAYAADSIGRPELRRKAFYVSSSLEVKVHKTSPGGTVIEFIKK